MENETTAVTDSGEKILFATRRHWAILIPPFFLLVFAGLSIPAKGIQAWVLVLIALAWVVVCWMNYQSAWFRLTGQTLLVSPGFPWRTALGIPLDTVLNVTVYQPVLGKFLDFGKVRVIRADGSKKFFRMVGSPHLLASAFYDVKAAQEVGKDAGTPE